MIIKLYKNCILTDAYSEVFDVYHKDANNKTALDRYLATLEQKTIATPHTYVTNSGKISFDLNDEDGTEFYDFNYMSITDEVNNFTRFCFIDAVTVLNGIAVVSYVEDVWSNYAPSLQMRKSLLTRSRIIDYGSYKIPFYSLGMEYQGNNQLSFVRLTELSGNVAIFGQVQIYKTSEQGEQSDREVLNCRMIKTDNTEFNIKGAVIAINEFVKNSSVKKLKKVNNEEYNYESFNYMIVPIEYADNSGNDVETVLTAEGQGISLNVLIGDSVAVTTQAKTVPSNFKQFKIGTFTNAFDIVQNGTNILVTIEQRNTPLETLFYLCFQNQIIDISSSFKYIVPISVQTADATQQQATAREIAQLNAKMGIASGAMQIGSAANDVAMGASKVAFGAYTGQLGSVLKGSEQISGAPFKAGQGIMNIISSKKQLDIANRAMYVSNKGTAVSNSAIVNAKFGIVLYEIQPDNEVEVQANIDNCGYVCNEIVDNLFKTITTGTTNKWNVMQFDYVNIYGKFTQRIADVLRDILNAGFKIWYDETAINE